jgi:hypothetical protein
MYNTQTFYNVLSSNVLLTLRNFYNWKVLRSYSSGLGKGHLHANKMSCRLPDQIWKEKVNQKKDIVSYQ